MFFFNGVVVVHGGVDWPLRIRERSHCHWLQIHCALKWSLRPCTTSHLSREHKPALMASPEKWDVIVLHHELIVVNLLRGFCADRPVVRTRIG